MRDEYDGLGCAAIQVNTAPLRTWMRYAKNWKAAVIAASLVYFFVPDEVLLENIGEQPDVRISIHHCLGFLFRTSRRPLLFLQSRVLPTRGLTSCPF